MWRDKKFLLLLYQKNGSCNHKHVCIASQELFLHKINCISDVDKTHLHELLKSNYNKNKCNHSKYIYLCTLLILIIFCPLNYEEETNESVNDIFKNNENCL